jgi:hypothetical protein
MSKLSTPVAFDVEALLVGSILPHMSKQVALVVFQLSFVIP